MMVKYLMIKEERGLENWERLIGQVVTIESLYQYPEIVKAAQATICFVDMVIGDSGGSGILVNGDGTMVTANHVFPPLEETWKYRDKGWEDGIPVLFDGGQSVLALNEIEVLARSKENDIVVLRSPKLAELPFAQVSSKPRLIEKGPYFVVGFPQWTIRYSSNFALSVSVGARLDREPLEGEIRDYLSATAWSGFSGGAVFDQTGFVRGITLHTSLSYTPDDYVKFLPAVQIPRWE